MVRLVRHRALQVEGVAWPCDPTEENREVGAAGSSVSRERADRADDGASGVAGVSKTAPELGRLVPPYPVEHCGNIDCPHGEKRLDLLHNEGAYLYRDLETNKLVVFCGDCGRHAELNAGLRFKLVAL